MRNQTPRLRTPYPGRPPCSLQPPGGVGVGAAAVGTEISDHAWSGSYAPGLVLSSLRKPPPPGRCCYPPHWTGGETEAQERSLQSLLRARSDSELSFSRILASASTPASGPAGAVLLCHLLLCPQHVAPSTQAAGGGQGEGFVRLVGNCPGLRRAVKLVLY